MMCDSKGMALGALVLMIILCLGSDVEAALIGQDSAFGSGTLTLDTQSGLQWLDMTLTAGMSYDEVVSEFGQGAVFEGFRVATAGEVDDLLLHGGFEATDNVQRAEDFVEAQAFVALLGANQVSVRGDATTGVVELAPPGQSGGRYLFGAFFGLPPFIEGNTGSANGLGSLSTSVGTDSATIHGVWLVAVPEPTAALLLVLAAPVLMRRNRI